MLFRSTDERAQDAVGNAVGTGLTYTDATGEIKVTPNTYDAYGAASTAASNAATALTNHENDTTNIHGIADTSALATKTYADNAVSTHEADTTNIHGITDTSKLVTTDGTQTLTGKTISAADNTVTINAADIVDVTASAAELNILDGVTASTAELNILDGATLSTTELNYVDGVTSAIQTQIDSKASLSGATFTGAVSGTDLTLSGNLTVNGTTTNINSTNLVVEDKNVVLGDTASPTDTTADGGGITLKGTTDKTLNWVDATDSWTSSENIDLASGKSVKINGTDVLTSSQVLGKSVPTGTIVGTSDSQTLTNKTLTSPVINTPTGITKSDVGLGNVNNTADADKPVSTATQTGLDAKAPLASPTFTGTVSGITKSMVGLGNVDNTSDANKPVSTAQQSALDLKANLASPTFTGTVTLPSGTVTSTMIADGTIVNADINASAAIDKTKISGTAITAADTGTVTSTMIADGTIVNADINASAAIALSKLATDPLARANHTGTQTASTISDFDTQVRTSKVTDLTAPTSALSMNSQKITNLATPTADNEIGRAHV